MTQEEIERLEARVNRAADWMQVGKPMPWDGFTEARDLAVEQTRALLVEVRRLRECVELAYFEGWMHGHSNGKDEVKLGAPPAMYDDFERSSAKRGLDAA